jgi:mxaC protein
MTSVDFLHPWWLAALVLVLLPLRRRREDEQVFGWNGWLPPDPMGAWRERAEKGIAMIAIAALVFGLAGTGTPETFVKRVGSGAETVVLLDRSASMDAALVPLGQLPGVDKYQEPKKRKVARRALAEFAAGRPDDVFALMLFSATQFQVMPFNTRSDMIQAAIHAGGVGSGLGNTDVGGALLAAIRLFDERPTTGNRIILLVSDGGAPLAPDVRRQISENLKRNHVTLYWIYLRSFNQPALADSADSRYDRNVEVAMHRFFSSLETPYSAFEAESPEAMGKAIAAVSRQQMMPITYQIRVPRVDRSGLCYLIFASACAALLMLRSQHLNSLTSHS